MSLGSFGVHIHAFNGCPVFFTFMWKTGQFSIKTKKADNIAYYIEDPSKYVLFV